MANKKCKSCAVLIDSGIVLCPNCIAKQVKKEIRNSIIFWMSIISLVFGIGLWQAYHHATKFMEKLLIERISHKFEEPHISETVQKVAETEAKRLLQEQVNPEVAKFKKETEASITETRELIQSEKANLNDLTTMIELEDAARYGSRKAFSGLVQLAARSDSLGKMALRRVLLIRKELLILQSVPGAYMGLSIAAVNGKQHDADELSTEELFLHLQSPNMAKEYIPAMMAHIAKKPEKEVCLTAKRILQSSDSLPASAATCGILDKVLGKKAQFLAFEDWIKVCEEELSKEK